MFINTTKIFFLPLILKINKENQNNPQKTVGSAVWFSMWMIAYFFIIIYLSVDSEMN